MQRHAKHIWGLKDDEKIMKIKGNSSKTNQKTESGVTGITNREL